MIPMAISRLQHVDGSIWASSGDTIDAPVVALRRVLRSPARGHQTFLLRLTPLLMFILPGGWVRLIPPVRRHPGGSQTAPRAVFSDIPNPPPELLELRLKLREVLANIGYCMAAGMGTDEQVLRHDLSVKFPDEGTDARLAALAAALESIAEEAEVSAVLAVSEHVLLPDPPVSS